jgi:NADH-quinone oxidoreductase subunit J
MEEYILNLNFYLFGIVAICSSVAMLVASNAVHSALYLILVYVAIVGIILTLGLEYIPILLIVVYVGAIAVLFLFVVMMINIQKQEIIESLYDYTFVGLLAGYILTIEFGLIITDVFKHFFVGNKQFYIKLYSSQIHDIEMLGNLLFVEYQIEFFMGGMILLLAMIAAIIITLYHRKTLKRQLVYKQLGRDYLETVILYNNAKKK